MLPWNFVDERMSEARIYWIATTRPNGRPHAVPLWGAWLDNILYFEGSPETRHGKNLSANPAVSVHLESGDQVVILEGEAREIQQPDHSITTQLAEIYAQKYQGYAPTPESWDAGGLYAVRPRVALAWMHFPKDVTRWKFGGE